jgi:hypothetical protein
MQFLDDRSIECQQCQYVGPNPELKGKRESVLSSNCCEDAQPKSPRCPSIFDDDWQPESPASAPAQNALVQNAPVELSTPQVSAEETAETQMSLAQVEQRIETGISPTVAYRWDELDPLERDIRQALEQRGFSPGHAMLYAINACALPEAEQAEYLQGLELTAENCARWDAEDGDDEEEEEENDEAEGEDYE